MKNITILMVVLALAFSFFEGGCSWFMWQSVPDRESPPMEIECRLAPPIVDTSITAGLGVISGLSFAALADSRNIEDDAVGIGAGLLFAYLGIGSAVFAAIEGAAGITGWVNYHRCRDYQASVDATKAFKTGPELFHPSPPNPETPNPGSAPADVLEGDAP